MLCVFFVAIEAALHQKLQNRKFAVIFCMSELCCLCVCDQLVVFRHYTLFVQRPDA